MPPATAHLQTLRLQLFNPAYAIQKWNTHPRLNGTNGTTSVRSQGCGCFTYFTRYMCLACALSSGRHVHI